MTFIRNEMLLLKEERAEQLHKIKLFSHIFCLFKELESLWSVCTLMSELLDGNSFFGTTF